MADKELAKALSEAKKKAKNFAIIGKGPNVLKLLVDKRPIKPGTLSTAKKECQGGVVVTGVVRGEGPDLVFQVLEDSPFAEAKLKKFIADETGLNLKPRFQVVTGLAEISEEEEEQAESSEPPPPPPPDPSKALLAAMNKLTPALKEAVVAHPDRKAELLRPVAEFQESLKAQRFDDARKQLAQVVSLIKELSGGGTTTPSTNEAPSTTEKPSTTEEPSPNEDEFRQLWLAARNNWQTSLDTVNDQLSQLQAAFRKDGDEEFAQIADQGLAGLLGVDRLQVPMQVGLMEVDRATGPALGKAANKARSAIAKFREFASGETALPLLDANPFGVKVSLRETLGSALAQLEAALSKLPT